MNKKIKIALALISALLVIALTIGIVFLILPEKSKSDVTKKIPTMGYGKVSDPNELTDIEKIYGFASVTEYGANSADDKDDTDAFEKAIEKGMPVYVPAGTYYISRPIAFNDQNIMGEGENTTFIVAKIRDKKMPILYLGGSSTISDICISYDKSLIDGKEKSGERVAISCGAAAGFGPGGGAKNVTFKSVGTAIYSDNSEGFGSNNCTYERIKMEEITYRGFDLKVTPGYGNFFRQINIINSNAESAFHIEGNGGADQIESLTLSNCKMKYAVGHTELAGVSVRQLFVDGCELSEETVKCID